MLSFVERRNLVDLEAEPALDAEERSFVRRVIWEDRDAEPYRCRLSQIRARVAREARAVAARDGAA